MKGRGLPLGTFDYVLFHGEPLSCQWCCEEYRDGEITSMQADEMLVRF